MVVAEYCVSQKKARKFLRTQELWQPWFQLQVKWAGRTIGVPTTGAAAGTMITIDEEVGNTGHAATVRGDRVRVVVTGNFYSKLLSKVIDGVIR